MFNMLAVTKTITNGIPLTHISFAFSALCFITILPAIFDPKKFREALDEFFSSSNAVIRLSSMVHFFLAFLILNSKWSLNLKDALTLTVMTGFGYLLLVVGVLWFWSPILIKVTIRRILQKEASIYVLAVLGILMGTGFGYLSMV